MVTRDSPSGTDSPPGALGPASLSPSRPWLVWRSRLEKGTRFLLWSAILGGTGVFLAQTASLLQSSTPRVPPSSPDSVPVPAANLLDGSWTSDDARYGLQGRLVGEEDLARCWRSMGTTPLPDSSSFDRDLAAFLGMYGQMTQTSDVRVSEQVQDGLRMRGVFAKDDPPRLRLFQVAVRNGAEWALGEILPSPEARVRQSIQALVPEIGGTRLLRRWSTDERMTGEVVIGTPPESILVRNLHMGGWDVEHVASPGTSAAWLIQRGSEQRLVMSFTQPSGFALSDPLSIPDGHPPEPAPGSRSAPPRLVLILQAASVQEHP